MGPDLSSYVPFEDVVKLIEMTRERIKNHSEAFNRSEAQTRSSLIDPFFRMLG